MKKVVGCILFSLCALYSYSQDRAIGIRLGDPMGITFKKYLPNHKAVELGLGTSTIGWHANYYKNSFHSLNRYEGYDYRSHDVRSTIYMQARYLFHYDIPIEGMIGKLEWYWGIGGLMKVAQVNYRYWDLESQTNLNDARTDIDIGPEGILGMEYTFEQVPLTIFGDISLMAEILDRPGVLRGFSGVGVRYNF